MNKKDEKEIGFKSEQDTYSVEIKYSKDAIKDKLVRFTVKDGNSFEISSDKLVELMSHYLNSESLAPAFVDTEKITVVYVKRQIKMKADRDIKTGEEFNVEYSHPYPLEFAIIEEGYKLALIDKEKLAVIVTPELLKQVKRDTPASSDNFIKKFYQAFKTLNLGGSS